MMTELALTLLAQAPATSGNPAALQGGIEITSVWDFVIKGGLAMIPIGLCSVVAMTIIVERLLVIRRSRVIPQKFLAEVRAASGDRRKALELCRGDGSPIARVLAAAISREHESAALREKHVEEAGQREVVGLKRRMRLLSALPQVSTMLGLLGTVFGMIHTFQAVSASSEALGKTEMLAKGIYEAWTTTASGLLVAVPVLVAYHMLMGRIDGLVAEIDRVALDWLEEREVAAPKPAPAALDRDGTATPATDGQLAPV